MRQEELDVEHICFNCGYTGYGYALPALVELRPYSTFGGFFDRKYYCPACKYDGGDSELGFKPVEAEL